jgi:hypothetical protein
MSSCRKRWIGRKSKLIRLEQFHSIVRAAALHGNGSHGYAIMDSQSLTASDQGQIGITQVEDVTTRSLSFDFRNAQQISARVPDSSVDRQQLRDYRGDMGICTGSSKTDTSSAKLKMIN